jgi:signal transduction histidine kinase
MAPVPVPKATRDPKGRWIAGVCTGLSENLGWPLPLVRFGFLVLTLANGLGIILYLAFWVVLPLRRGTGDSRETDLGRMVAFGGVVVGLAVLLYAGQWGALRTYVAPVLVLGVGLAILWQQWGSDNRAAFADDRFRWVRPFAGAILVAAGMMALLVGEIGWLQGLRAFAVILLLLGGAAVLALPWLARTYRDLATERRALIREQERTEIATQVHDSVLQTLTLIQQNADSADQVNRLARTEERRLRAWLYEPLADGPDSLAVAIRRSAATVEAGHGANIDVVQVGDAAMTPNVAAIVAAATEAIVNAAKHAGPQAQVSVYCEATDDSVAVFVRDRGPGFDPTEVAEDRHGIRHSIVGRMRRAGGTAEIVAASPGTEVRLSVDLEDS